MCSTPRLIAAAAALAIVVAVVVRIYRQGGDEVRTSIERQNNKLAALRTMSARFDLCPPGMWGFGAGKCRLSPASGGRLLKRLDPPYFGAEIPVNDDASYPVTGRLERVRWPLDRATGNSARVPLERCRFEYGKPCRSLSVKCGPKLRS